MNLPSKDKNGNSYLSYSQISLFLKDKDKYYKTYILKEPFVGNKYTDFGSKVGLALEKNDFSAFSDAEINILKSVTRLDVFERMTILKCPGFYILGYIDTATKDLTQIIDYKTGGKRKEFQYSSLDYDQLCYYALSIKQETGSAPAKASVEFIRRADIYGDLIVDNEPPIKIDVDISESRLKKVYWNAIKTAKEIELFYENKLLT